MRRFTVPILLLVSSLVPVAARAQAGVSTGTDAGVPPRPVVVQPIPLAKPLATVLAGRKATTSTTVPATGAWVDTGLVVAPGDHLELSATGSLTLADERRTAPAGLPKGWKDLLRSFPDQAANTGALVGRIGGPDAAVPFAVGGALGEDVPTSGELFLAANLGDALAGTGRYLVTIKLGKATQAITDAPSIDLQPLLTASLLASLPRRVTDQQGDPGDVVNFAVAGTQAELQKAFTAAGWVQVDKTTDDALVHGLISTLSKKAYVEMPMSMLFLYGRSQDFSYARADPLMVAVVRHHLRVWSTGETLAGRPLWVGSATHDNGLERDERNNGLTHHIDPNIDVERDFIEQSFAAAGTVAAAAYATPVDPVRSARTATGGSFQTDGRVLVMVLRGQ